MKKKKSSKQAGGNKVVLADVIERRIFLIRSNKVLLSTHLAQLYEVEPKVLIQAVKRNIERFPSDFMFQLTKKEFENLKSQIVTSSWGGIRRPAYSGMKLAGANANCLSFVTLAGALVVILVRKTRHYQFRKPRFVGAGLALPALAVC